MNKELKKIFESVPGVSSDVIEQFITILDLPNDKFDRVYPHFKNEVSKIYEGEEFQQQLLKQMKLNPDIDIEEEKAGIKTFLDEITKDDSLSDNKKEMLTLMFESTINVFEQLAVAQRQMIKVKVTKLNPNAILPTYAHPTDAGADISAVEEVRIEPNETKIIKTGIAVAIPAGYEIQIRPRSGLSIKTGLRIPNSPGTIDTDYRGEIGVPIWNTGDTAYVIDKGMKIAQMLIAPTPMIKWDEVSSVEELGNTTRGDGGFGSTDRKAANAG